MKPIRLLIVEDAPADAELMVHALRRHGYAPEWRYVDNQEDYLAALDSSLDLILADYNLPSFNGLRALELLKDADLDIPFVIVSGSIGEDAAVKAMRAGAADYLLKDRLARIGPAVERALIDKKLRSENRRVMQELRESEERYRTLVEAAEDAIFIVGADLRFKLINRAGAEGLGRDQASIIGKHLDEVFAPPTLARVIESNQRVLQTAAIIRLEEELDLPGHGLRWSHTVLAPITGANGAAAAVMGVSRDITELKRAQQALRESVTHYRMLFASNPQPMLLYEVDTLRVLDANDALIAKYGYTTDELLRMTIVDLHPPEDVPRLRALVSEPRPRLSSSGPWKHRKKDGTWLDVEVLAHDLVLPDGKKTRLVLANDVTEQKQLENQFRQAQKMEAVGRLAGGVAHDFNNLLTAILGYTDMAIEQMEGHPVVSDLQEVRQAGERAQDLTHQLLAFSRQQIIQPRVVNVNDVLAGMEKILGRLIGEDVKLALEVRQDIGCVRIDPGQLEQVIMNLAVNARDAMPGGGVLKITTSGVTLTADYAHRSPPVVAGPYVMITVEDNGSGMSAEAQQHLFEPFFTTKEPGKGTGLGLATVYGIVKQSGGYIWLTTRSGVGTTFTLHFPVAPASEPERWPRESAAESPKQGSETVLVVEDNTALRNLATRVLRQAGYMVLAATDGEEAIRIGREHDGPIHLMFTDVVMPHMSGRAAFNELQKFRPSLKVLYSSGYMDDTIVHHGVLEEGILLLPKPYTPSVLVRKIREVLESTE